MEQNILRLLRGFLVKNSSVKLGTFDFLEKAPTCMYPQEAPITKARFIVSQDEDQEA